MLLVVVGECVRCVVCVCGGGGGGGVWITD